MYKGFQITLPLGVGGLDANENDELVKPTSLISARNIRYDEDTIKKADGLIYFSANTVVNTPSCVEAIEWRPDTATQRIVSVWNNGIVYKEVSGDTDNVELVNSLTVAEPVTFIDAGRGLSGENRELYMFGQGFYPQILDGDGTSMANITAFSTDWSASANTPAGAVYHEGRIFAFAPPNAPHNLYVSSLENPGNFNTETDSPIYDIAPGEGERISAAFSFLSQRLYLWKFPRGIYYVDTSYIPGYLLPLTTIRRDVGAAGPHAVAKVGSQGIWFISSTGRIYNLDILMNPDLDPKDADITALLNLEGWLHENVDLNYIKFARLFYDESRKEVWAMYVSKYSANHLCDRGIVFDVNDPQNIRAAVEDRGEYFNTMFHYRNSLGEEDVYCAGVGGYIYKANNPTLAIGSSTAYYSEAQTPHMGMSHVNPELRNTIKRFDWLELKTIAKTSSTLYVDVILDGVLYQTHSFSLDAAGSSLDSTSFTLDTPDPGEGAFTLGGTSVTRDKKRIGGLGKTISLRFYSNTASADFAISSAILNFKPIQRYGEVS